MRLLKCFVAFTLSTVMLLSLPLETLAISPWNGSTSSGSGQDVKGGTIDGYYGYSIGITTPRTPLTWTNEGSGNNADESNLDIALHRHYAANFPVVDSKDATIIEENIPSNPIYN